MSLFAPPALLLNNSGSVHPRARVPTPSPLVPVLRQPASAPFLASVTIANPGVTHGLRAKFGRLFSLSSSSAEPPSLAEAVAKAGASGKQLTEGLDLTAAVMVAQQQRDSSSVEEQGGARKPRGSTSGGGMETLYISHGSPMLPVQFDDPARQFLVRLGKQMEKPKAIVIVSAHWDTTEPTVTAVNKHDTIYDFYGFPKELYQMTYDAPGNPALAQRVVNLLKLGGFPKAKKDERRGLDHGAWVPLFIMFPEKDIPIVQLSVQYRKDGAHHYKVGQALATLKDEGVLVIGSGSVTHNLGAVYFDGRPVVPWAIAFDNWLNDALCNNRYEDVINYIEKAPYALKAHPTPDHFLPFIVALGAAGQDATGEQLHSSWALGSVSMASYALKPPSAAAAASA